jgi:ferredoxin/flavodoxin---NADP+ reductase
MSLYAPAIADQPNAQPLASRTLHFATVLWVRHWTDDYFSFAINRPASFRFRSGEFVMIGLPIGGKPVMRAYSIASPTWADELEFFSIKAPGGLLTTEWQKIRTGDEILLGRKPTGTLVLDALCPGRNLFLLGTGTGLAPWLSIIRDPATYEQFERVVVAHGVREVKDLAYRDFLERDLPADEILGDLVLGRLAYYPCVTRERFEHQGRLTQRIADGSLFRDLDLPQTTFDPQQDRVMLCGSTGMIRDAAAMLEAAGMREGSNANPGDFVIERAFVG